MSKPLEGI